MTCLGEMDGDLFGEAADSSFADVAFIGGAGIRAEKVQEQQVLTLEAELLRLSHRMCTPIKWQFPLIGWYLSRLVAVKWFGFIIWWGKLAEGAENIKVAPGVAAATFPLDLVRTS